jgi:hypothetical protein
MKVSIETLKEYFFTGKKPVQENFFDLIDSFVHKDELEDFPIFSDRIQMDNVEGLTDLLTNLSETLDRQEIQVYNNVVQLAGIEGSMGEKLIVKNQGIYQWGIVSTGTTSVPALNGGFWNPILVLGSGGSGTIPSAGLPFDSFTLTLNGTRVIPAGQSLLRIYLTPNENFGSSVLLIGTTPDGNEIATYQGNANQKALIQTNLVANGDTTIYFSSPDWFGGQRSLNVKLIKEL